MALKTKKPDFSSIEPEERLSALNNYIDELTDEVEFRFDVLTEAVERLRRMNGAVSEGGKAQ